MNKDNDISNDDVSEYNNYNLNKCLEEYYKFLCREPTVLQIHGQC